MLRSWRLFMFLLHHGLAIYQIHHGDLVLYCSDHRQLYPGGPLSSWLYYGHLILHGFFDCSTSLWSCPWSRPSPSSPSWAWPSIPPLGPSPIHHPPDLVCVLGGCAIGIWSRHFLGGIRHIRIWYHFHIFMSFILYLSHFCSWFCHVIPWSHHVILSCAPFAIGLFDFMQRWADRSATDLK